jgi:chromosome segregation ATPase
MGRFVGVCVLLFVVAAVAVILAQGAELAAMVAAFRSQPPLYKLAWAVVVLVPLAMLGIAAWLGNRLARQRRTTAALEARLDGVRAQVKDISKAQAGTDPDLQRLVRSDPEDAVAALVRRVSDAERFVQIQESRNRAVDLEARVGALRAQQQALTERLAPVLETRRSIEQVFTELDSRQSNLERSLAEVASSDDGTALDLRLRNLTDFVRGGNFRCDQIEQASKTVAALSEACAEMRARLAPFAAAEDGIVSRLRRLGEERDRLAAEIDALERLPEGPLAGRVAHFTEDSKQLDESVSHLYTQFCQLAGLRKDVAGLFAAFERALDTLSLAKGVDGPAGIDARVDELSRFLERTETQFDDIERRRVAFEQLKTRLGELHTRLSPLESEQTGIIKLIDELHELRERLIVKIRRIEGGEQGDLAARVKLFADAKRELEDRVSALADQFTKLSTIRKDIAGLFDKLSSAVNTSAN